VNRDRTSKELERRYQEAVLRTKDVIETPLQYEQMLVSISHYMQFLTANRLLRGAVKRLTGEKKAVKTDKEIATEAAELIARIKQDRDKLVEIAQKKGIPIILDPEIKGAIPENYLFAVTLGGVDEFLGQDDREVSQIPKHLGNMRVMVQRLVRQGVSKRDLKPYADPYSPLQNEFAKKLRLHQLYTNYLRLDDYKVLEDVRRYIYQEMTEWEEQIVFLSVDNDDLIDYSHTKQYDRDELYGAKQRQIEYAGYLMRLHNYLVDYIDKLPFMVRMWRWLFANFGSTFVSVLIIVGLYFLALWAGLPIEPEKLIDWFLK
jgi:hypothetical protein